VKYVTVAEAAELLKVNCQKIRRWIAAGELPAANIALSKSGERPRYRISEAALQRFLASRGG
jgi:excisionase family DNA binding protein